MSKLSIRKRTEADLPQLAKTLVKVYALDGYPVEGVAAPLQWLSPATLEEAWVAEVDGAAVGQALLTRPSTEDSDIWRAYGAPSEANVMMLARVFVDPEFRKLGAGQLLLETVNAWAVETHHDLLLDVMVKDEAAMRLYERNGWRKIHQTDYAFGDGKSIKANWYVYHCHSQS